MCVCKQIKKEPAGTLGNFNYTFECKKSDGTVKEIKVSSGNDNVAKMLAELECGEDKKQIAVTIETYIDSTTIRTGNSVANVNVRHKIITGAGAGTVYTKANGGGDGHECSVGVLMGVWSPWVVLINHIGVINVSIENSYPNDIGVISEVRYY